MLKHIASFPGVTLPGLHSTAEQQQPKTHTLDHINCPACEGTRSMYLGTITREMSFSQAVDFYLNWRTAPLHHERIQFISSRTLKDYRQKAKALEKFFGNMALEKIHLGNLKEYQTARLNGDGYTRKYGEREVQSKAGVIKINAELSLLKRLMTMATCWTPELEMYYLPFQEVDSELPRALDPVQQERFLQTAASNPRWHPIWWYGLVVLDVVFSSDEMRTIRIGDINLTYQILGVNRRYGKNKTRRREVPIADGRCLWALGKLMERAKELYMTSPKYFSVQPHYFLFPRRIVTNLYDPELPMGETGLRKLFEEVRDAAGVPWFCINGFRHTGLTRYAEAGTPMQIMSKRAGHIGADMTQHYIQISEQAERLAVRNAFARKPVVSVDGAHLRQKVAGY